MKPTVLSRTACTRCSGSTSSGTSAIDYEKSNLAFSGFARYGLLQELTVGANVQFDSRQWLAGGEAGYASPIGNFEIYNATYIGAGTNSTGARAFISREYAAPKVFNTIFTEFNIGGNIDAKSGTHFTNGLDPEGREIEAAAVGDLPPACPVSRLAVCPPNDALECAHVTLLKYMCKCEYI